MATTQLEIWEVSTNGAGWYVEGLGADGWFCFETDTEADLDKQLAALGFDADAVAAAKAA